MLVRNIGIRDISEIEGVSIGKVLSVLSRSNKVIKPKQKHYVRLEVDEFRTYVKHKNHKVWLIYAYNRQTGEIVAWVWGGRNYKTAKRLKQRIEEHGLTYEFICTDDWPSFVKTFGENKHIPGKKNTVGIKVIIAGYSIV